MRPSELLNMTLPMFDVLTVQGPSNAKVVDTIFSNLLALRKALLNLEAKFDEKYLEELSNDNRNEQTENV